MKKQFRLFISLAAVAFVIIGAIALSSNRKQDVQSAFLEKYALNGLTVPEIVQKLDSSIAEPGALFSSITGEKLTLKDADAAIELPIPEDSFYLSFAPYGNSTHPCAFHSLSSCRGELVNVTVNALIKDKNGQILLDQPMTTMENGFIGVWLPRNIDATIEVSYNGKTATAPISTYAGSDTCLTTPLRLN